MMLGCPIDNKLAELCEPIVDDWSADQIAEQMVNKVNLISSIHVAVLTNVEEAKKKQKRAYAAHKGNQFFEGFAGGQSGEDETSLGAGSPSVLWLSPSCWLLLVP
jgi:hypothetical protein